MPTAPAADQLKLLDVQAADLRAQQALHRRATLPVLLQLDELTGRVVDLSDERAARGAVVGDARREVTKIEDDVAAVRARAARDNARLASGQGTPKDLQALSSELEVLNRRVTALEDTELEVMERLEEAEKELASADTQHREIAAQIAELERERDLAFAAIDAELRQHRVIHPDPTANPAIDRMMLAQTGQRTRRTNPISRRVQPKRKQNAWVRRRATRRLATRLDAVVKPLKVQAFNEGPHRPYLVVVNHQALKVDQLKTCLVTLCLPNANVHHALRIHPRNESHHQKNDRPDEAIHSFFARRHGLLRGACHRARIRATRWLAMTWI